MSGLKGDLQNLFFFRNLGGEHGPVMERAIRQMVTAYA